MMHQSYSPRLRPGHSRLARDILTAGEGIAYGQPQRTADDLRESLHRKYGDFCFEVGVVCESNQWPELAEVAYGAAVRHFETEGNDKGMTIALEAMQKLQMVFTPAQTE